MRASLWADVTDELLRRTPSPLRTKSFLGRNEVAAVMNIQPVGVGPMLVNPAPRISPVVVDLTAEKVTADPPHVFIFGQAVEVFVAHEHVVDVLHLEREMVQAGTCVAHAEERVVINVVI